MSAFSGNRAEAHSFPYSQGRAWAWMSKNLFGSVISSLITIGLVLAIGFILVRAFEWAVLDAVWAVPEPTIDGTAACRANAAGACWALIAEKYRFILFGLYPFDEQWRPAAAAGFMLLLFVLTASRIFNATATVLAWALGLLAVYFLLGGGVFGLSRVTEDKWGGLPVTLLLASSGMALAFPIAIAVALGRLSKKPALRLICYLYVEIVRGVPLISVLFMASTLFPLLLPDGVSVSKLLRALLAMALFIAAYLSEIIRGGLQGLDPGQDEAATALGLRPWQTTLFIKLPQALSISLPPIISLQIGYFKGTALVMTIGIFDLLNTARSAASEPAWQGFETEAYLFVALIYFLFCFTISRYGVRLEKSRSYGRSSA